MKKLVCVVMLVCIMLSMLPNHAYAGFKKASDWAVPELNTADTYGLIPESIQSDMSIAITRKEFAEVCVRLYERITNATAESAPPNTFSDTQHVDVRKAFKLGIVTGIGDKKFGPDITTNREQIATMLKRLLNALTPGMNSFQPEQAAYQDRNQISSWALESVDLASEYQFITGWSNLFAAKGECTREMAVIIAKRVYEFYNGEVLLNEAALLKSEILGIAEKYYKKTIAGVEKKDEFLRVIDFAPDFSGAIKDMEKARLLSADAAHLITFTSAKNMYVAFAAALFTLSPDSATSANNLAAALATYNDEMIDSGKATDEIYEDALCVYKYALQKSKKGGKLTSDSPNILVSLGNLYLDTNQFQQAYAAFQMAYQFDKGCSGAMIGLMNYCLAKGDSTNAMKYANGINYPVIAQEIAEIEDKKPDILKQPPLSASASEGELEEAMVKNKSIPVITVFDYFKKIEPKAYDDARRLIDSVKGKMQLKAPEITMLTQYYGLQNISKPMGQSAQTSFAAGLSVFNSKTVKAEARVNSLQSELDIFQYMPYDYANYVDILVQRYHVSALQRKMIVLPIYADKMNTRIAGQIEELAQGITKQLESVDKAEKYDLEVLADNLEGMEMSSENRMRRFHSVHEKYRIQRNGVKNIAYNEMALLADEAYLKKIKPFVEAVFNDCMGHIMMIGDQDVQKSLETRLYAHALRALTDALDNVLQSRKMMKWEEPFELCKCPLPEMEEEKKRLAAEKELVVKAQVQNDEAARKIFEVTDISEFSQLYEKSITQYETEVNSISINGKISFVQSSWRVNIGLKQGIDKGIHFENLVGYFRNTTTYDGGFTITAKAFSGQLEGKLASFVGAGLLSRAEGTFSPSDLDIYLNTAVSGREGLSSATYRADAFATRGTRFHALAVITGNAVWDEQRQRMVEQWPNIQLQTWDGQY